MGVSLLPFWRYRYHFKYTLSQMVDGELSIGRIAAQARLRPSAIRYYEAEGLLPQPRRRSGKRVYNRSILDRLALIELATQCGFTVAETRTLLHGFAANTRPARRWSVLARAKLAELNATAARIGRMKRLLNAICKCECPSLEECGIRSRRSQESAYSDRTNNGTRQ